jgi:hypothetical protein
MSNYPDNVHYVNAKPPVADAFDDSGGAVVSDVINVSGCNGVEFLLYRGVGATGTALITILSCDDVTPTNSTAVAFWYKQVTSDPGDTAWTLATTAGFTTAAGSNAMFRCWVPADLIGQHGRNYAQLSLTEPTDSPVLGGILAILHGPKFEPVISTVIT